MKIAMMLIALTFGLTSGPLQQTEQVYEAGNGVTVPTVVHEVKPQYTAEAMQARVQGSVWLKGVVRRGGNVTDIVVEKPLHPQLDKEAIAAFGQYEFTPGTREGKPVPVRITVEMTFTLK